MGLKIPVFLAEPEVDQMQDVRVFAEAHKEILRFYITMHITLSVEHLDPLQLNY